VLMMDEEMQKRRDKGVSADDQAKCGHRATNRAMTKAASRLRIPR